MGGCLEDGTLELIWKQKEEPLPRGAVHPEDGWEPSFVLLRPRDSPPGPTRSPRQPPMVPFTSCPSSLR